MNAFGFTVQCSVILVDAVLVKEDNMAINSTVSPGIITTIPILLIICIISDIIIVLFLLLAIICFIFSVRISRGECKSVSSA